MERKFIDVKAYVYGVRPRCRKVSFNSFTVGEIDGDVDIESIDVTSFVSKAHEIIGTKLKKAEKGWLSLMPTTEKDEGGFKSKSCLLFSDRKVPLDF